MTYEADEASVEDSRPRELVTLEINPPTGQIWRHTSGTADITYAGLTYTAIAIERGDTSAATTDREDDVDILLPVDHDIVRRYLKQGVPPGRIRATVQRLQVRSGEVRQLWTGDVTSMACDDGVARLLVPAKTMETIKRMLPLVSSGRACPHILYGEAGCGVIRTSSFGPTFKVTTTVISVAGREVRIDLSNVAAVHEFRATWTRFGEIVHTASGERRSIADQVDTNPGVSTVTDITMYERIVEMKVGDSVDVYAGCDHTAATCRDKFANQFNYGGLPELPVANPFKREGFGQE